MDFDIDEEQAALQGLTRRILTDKATPERVREVETTESRVDEALWAELARAGVLGAAVPEEYGGAGLGLSALCVVLEEQGRHVAPVPLWSSLLGALTLAAHGTTGQRALLPGLVDGSSRVTVALEEPDGADPAVPQCVAVSDGSGWRLEGAKAVVPSPGGAAHVLVSAATPDGPGVFLVAADDTGAAWEVTHTTTHDRAAHLVLGGAEGDPVGSPGSGATHWLLRRAVVALAALQAGVAEGALRLASAYTSERRQFGRPLGTFQSLQHQLADCYIDIDAMRVTLWQAVSSVETGEGPPGAVQVAAWWARQAGLDVVHRAVHVHGGMGVDVDYPVHRFFLWGRQLATTLGGAGTALEELGDVLAGQEIAS
jgi:acyl-CoA dehydrogenase